MTLGADGKGRFEATGHINETAETSIANNNSAPITISVCDIQVLKQYGSQIHSSSA
jgi:hypothetical protein